MFPPPSRCLAAVLADSPDPGATLQAGDLVRLIAEAQREGTLQVDLIGLVRDRLCDDELRLQQYLTMLQRIDGHCLVEARIAVRLVVSLAVLGTPIGRDSLPHAYPY